MLVVEKSAVRHKDSCLNHILNLSTTNDTTKDSCDGRCINSFSTTKLGGGEIRSGVREVCFKYFKGLLGCQERSLDGHRIPQDVGLVERTIVSLSTHRKGDRSIDNNSCITSSADNLKRNNTEKSSVEVLHSKGCWRYLILGWYDVKIQSLHWNFKLLPMILFPKIQLSPFCYTMY